MTKSTESGGDWAASPAAEALARSYAELMDRDSGDGPAGPDDGNPAPMPVAVPPPVHRVVEALLFLGGQPLTLARASEAIRGLSSPDLLQAIEVLNRDYRHQGRPYRIRSRDQGYELILLPRFRAVQERLFGSVREARLTPTALDVLALVAYRQPVTKSEVDSLRGGDSSAPLRQLVRVGLISVQRGEAGLREVSYGTTPRFLSLFGLSSLDDLPRTQDPQRM